MMPIAQNCVQLCAALLPLYAHHSRHGGTWLVVRRTFSCALVILASVLRQHLALTGKRDHIDLDPPEHWQGLTRLALRILDSWASESLEFRRMQTILRGVYSHVCSLVGSSLES